LCNCFNESVLRLWLRTSEICCRILENLKKFANSKFYIANFAEIEKFANNCGISDNLVKFGEKFEKAINWFSTRFIDEHFKKPPKTKTFARNYEKSENSWNLPENLQIQISEVFNYDCTRYGPETPNLLTCWYVVLCVCRALLLQIVQVW